MPFVVVVRRDEPSLFDYLRLHFQEPEITVVMDRRGGERRRRSDPVEVERRKETRRAAASDDDPLWKYGFRVAVAKTD